jgi:hypothetical protein
MEFVIWPHRYQWQGCGKAGLENIFTILKDCPHAGSFGVFFRGV